MKNFKRILISKKRVFKKKIYLKKLKMMMINKNKSKVKNNKIKNKILTMNMMKILINLKIIWKKLMKKD